MDVINNTDLINNIDNIKIKGLDLLDATHNMDYENYNEHIVKDNYMIAKAGNVLDNIFKKEKTDIGKAILMSYAFSSYGDDIFKPYKTNMDNKLIRYSNKLIKYLANIINGRVIDDEFYVVVNKYYSLFMIWQSKEKIREITKLFQELMDLMESSSVMDKLGIYNQKESLSKTIIAKYEIMLTLNRTIAIGMIMRSYATFKTEQNFSQFYWSDICSLNFNLFWEVILIIIIDVKGKLSNTAKDINMRKRIYYSIDTDDLTKKMYKRELKIDNIIHIMVILNSYMESINKQQINIDEIYGCPIESQQANYEIVAFFKEFCNAIY
jgi:hypothetical protein